MRTWLILTGGLLLWTIHFFALWTLSSLFEDQPAARIGFAIVTLLCLAGAASLIVVVRRGQRSGAIPPWLAGAGLIGGACGLVSILFQGFTLIA